MRVTETMVLFWGGPFSQWFKAGMTIDGVSYNCCEQYMMAMKAKEFNDTESLEKIMKTKDPSVQKQIGRKVKKFNVPEWNRICKEVVYRANLAKFSQHKDLKELLLKTGDKEIVEASPYDRIWGIGMGENDPDALDKTKWNGLNWLGEAIMRVRKELLEKESNGRTV